MLAARLKPRPLKTIHASVLVEKGVDEGGAVEGDDVFDLFADSGVDVGESEPGGDGEDDAALGCSVELGYTCP
jgi:hypothetical protein